MSTTYYFESKHNEILLKSRTWDGVGQAQHFLIDRISLPLAKGTLTKLEDAIREAEIYEKEMIERREKDLEKEIQQKQNELDLLRKKRELEQNKRLGIEPDDDYTPI